MFQLPLHQPKIYPALNRCMYCGSTSGLSDEHIVPFGLGGRVIVPKSSCADCAKKTGRFERTCQRTMFGPLRMYYDLPTRRPQERPKTLPLKVRVTAGTDWSFIEVDQQVYPFLILFPFLDIPDELSRTTTESERGAKVKRLWIRSASFRDGIIPHLETLAAELKVVELMPTGNMSAPDFFRMLAKIAHAVTAAELGLDSFEPFLLPIIRDADTSNSVQYVGGMAQEEPASTELHEIDLGSWLGELRDIITVRVRLLAVLGTPTYFVAVGRKR